MEHPHAQVFEEKPHDFLSPVEVSACYLEIDGRVLLLQSSSEKKEAGTWGLPAGKLKPTETLEDAAIRELWEETGIIAPVTFLSTMYIRKFDTDYSFHLFHVSLEKIPEICLSKEHLAYIWASKEDLKTLPLMPAAREVLQKHYKESR